MGPEPFFLRALSQLKVCDYPAVLQTLNVYRERFKPRAVALKALTADARTPQVDRIVAKLKSGAVKLTDLGADAAMLPRFVTRDEILLQNVLTERALEQEAKTAGELYARSLTGGTAQVGFQARLEAFKKAVETRAQGARSATYGRVKTLAEEEITEISAMLQKLHIAETELIQQISVSDRVIGATKVCLHRRPAQPEVSRKTAFGSQQRTRPGLMNTQTIKSMFEMAVQQAAKN